MAGSRLERVGTVFTRVRDLMRSGVVKPTEKPVWYDVYAAFPPKRDQLHLKPHIRPWTKQETVPEIFYREDGVRAKFYEQYGTGPRPIDLSKSNFVSACQRFVDKYTELQSNSELGETALFEETGKALLTDGIVLRRRGIPPVSAENRDPVLELKLTDMLAEQQSVGANNEETMEHTTHKL
ncbi:28S ribosomal protein S23, mitochondrial isoform X1 [Micropterus salmoides]|uniref:28S ribosomal protein S23, mitochondrial isoform X1 n=1 Tax=Micropterus salmoides TaxID=27706 RepID=UPI0018EDFA58|nr:28S ribosomal protein S23, mitochondrial isoform X1 [Micropterus salmoides]